MIVGPNLSLVDAANTLAQTLQWIVLAEKASCACAKSLHDDLILRGAQQHDGAGFAMKRSQFLEDFDAAGRMFVERGTDDQNINLFCDDRCDEARGLQLKRGHFQERVALQSVCQQTGMDT